MTDREDLEDLVFGYEALRAENARLREVLEDMQADNAKLTAENASLREGWSHEV